MKPIVIINFKTYAEAAGTRSLPLAQKIAKARRKGYEVIIAPSLLTVKEIAAKVRIPVYAQHTDNVDLGAHTGRIAAKELKKIGVQGTILNHSERKIPLHNLAGIILNCRKNKLKMVVCASSLSEVMKVAALHPEYIAYEPPKLIGTDISVTEAKPEAITHVVETVHRISPRTKVLCGAGVHTREDIKHALALGTVGVLIGHAVPKARNPQKFLEKMLMD